MRARADTPPSEIVPTQQPADLQLRDIVPDIDRLSEVTSVNIVRGWNGLNMGAPFVETYPLLLANDQFTGVATVSAGNRGSRFGYREVTVTVSVPVDLVRRSLQPLTGVGVIKGRYIPRIVWTDDYPNTQLLLTLPSGQALRFFSTSQGKLQVPWGVEYAGQTYIVHGDAVASILADVEPHLMRQQMRDLARDFEKEVTVSTAQERRDSAERQLATIQAGVPKTPSPSPSPSPASR